MQRDPVRIVLIGAGNFGTYHLRKWRKVVGAEVVGVYDQRPEVAEAAADEHDIKRVYRSLSTAVADSDVDAVDICTPNMRHRECVLAALEAGKHCLCEKPLAAHAADIEAMLAARDRSGRILMTAQHLRFEPQTLALKRVLATGRLGHVYYSRAVWLRRRLAPTTAGFLTRAQGGFGPGMDIGVHILDLTLHLLGQPQPVSVSGYATRQLAHEASGVNEWGPYDVRQFEVEDLAVGLVRFADGGVLVLEVSWLLNMLEKESRGIWLHGTEGGVRWPELTFAHVQDELLVDSQVVSQFAGDGYINEMTAFVDAIRTGGPSPVPAEESRSAARVLEGLYQSAESGREIRLAE